MTAVGVALNATKNTFINVPVEAQVRLSRLGYK